MTRYEALKIAVKAHGKELDRCGELAVLHPMAVAEQLEHTELAPQNDAVVVAYLHDVWEDTDYELKREWFTEVQWNALYLVTRQPTDTYAEYIEGICGDRIASLVKLADLAHNLSPERQGCLPEGERKGLEKRYLKARDRIWEALGSEWWPESGGGS